MPDPVRGEASVDAARCESAADGKSEAGAHGAGQLPPWPAFVTFGSVMLREFVAADAAMAMELATDPYVALIGSLPPQADQRQAGEWIERQQGRCAEGVGYSVAIADARTGRGLGSIGLWLASLAQGRAAAGYAVAPSGRGRGIATAAVSALTCVAWTIPGLHRIKLYIEPWNIGSVTAAERAGYVREGLLRSHQEIGGKRRDMLLYAHIKRVD